MRLRGNNLRYGILSALLLPAAVLFLTFQILAFPHGGLAAVILIGLELLLLVFALLIPFCNFGAPRKEWVNARLRAELLRREEFLLRTRVGPYLTIVDAKPLACRARERIAQIDSDLWSPLRVLPLTPLSDVSGPTWRDELEDIRVNYPDRSARPDRNSWNDYLLKRLEAQISFFESKRGRYQILDTRLDNLSKVAVVLALALSGMHLLALLGGGHGSGTDRSPIMMAIEIAAVTMPGLGSAAVALRSVFEGRRLSRSYRYHSVELANLRALHHALATEMTVETPTAEATLRFKRLVLRTEALLSDELRQWGIITLD